MPNDAQMTFRMTLVGVQLVSFVLPIVVSLLTPGRKGKMRTERTQLHPRGTVAGTGELYLDRLKRLRFEPKITNNPNVIKATRPKAKDQSDPFGAFAFSGKALEAEVVLTQQAEGVEAKIVSWMPDLVLKDTGEGRYMDRILDELAGIPVEDQRPIPNHSFNATCAVYQTAIVWVAALALAASTGLSWDQIRGASFGLWSNIFIAFVLAGLAIRSTIIKPDEVTGRQTAFSAIILGLSAAAFVAVIFKMLMPGE